MRFLVDTNLSAGLAQYLNDEGHDAEHVTDQGLASASDAHILEAAAAQDRVLISSDTDFGTLLSQSGARSPSLILLRRISNRRVRELAALLLANLVEVAEPIEAGAVVVIEESRIRVRMLPFV